MSRKTIPAPVFNYRKRQRQAVFSDPETQPRSPLQNKKQQDLSIWCQGDMKVAAPQPLGPSSLNQGFNTNRDLPSAHIPLLPAPRAAASTTRPAVPGTRSTFSATRPALSSTRPSQARHALSSRPAFSSTRPTLSAAQPALSAIRPALSSARPAPSATAPTLSASSVARPTQSATRQALSAPAVMREPPGPGQKNTFSNAGLSHNEWSDGWSLQKSIPGAGLQFTAPHQIAASLPSSKEKTVGKRRNSEAASLQVLTVPIAYLKRVKLHLQSSTLPPLMFTLYGILDSAIVPDRTTSGKSFVLRDETGSINGIFFEIDRQVPRLHRGQWYRVVCVMKSMQEAVQCLSIRPVNVEERQAVSTAKATSTAALNKIISDIMEQ